MQRQLERSIWFFTVAIMVIGLICLYSASFQNVRVSQQVFFDQLICAGLGLLLMFFLGRMDYRKFLDVAYVFFALSVILLVLVLVAGRHALGARRWFEMGSFSFQPSELTKLSVILILARYFSERHPTLSFDLRSSANSLLRDLIFPFVLILIPAFLIFKQPDLGTAILIFGIFLIMLFVSGLEYRKLFGFLCVIICAVPFVWHVLKPYQKDRLLVFLNPNIDPLGAGYTIIQSKIAIGSGGLFGKGWLSGTQSQLNFLPERHTDFIFSVIGEEWGLMGTLLLVFCFFMLINCGLKIADQIKDKFGMLVTVGIVAILTLQVIINIGMVLGLFPVVGITLPFISYGRSSFLIFVVMMGFLLNMNKNRTIF